MSGKSFAKSFFVVLVTTSFCLGCSDTKDLQLKETKGQKCTKEISEVDKILNRLNEKTRQLQSYQCHLEYLVRQPLFEAQTLRKGNLYYQKGPKDSMLRINFDTIKQDDEPEDKEKLQFLFDGIWLTRIDYQLKEVKKHQLIDPNELDPNETIDAFDLISENFPIIGFTKTDKLKQQFDIKLIEPNEPEDFFHLRLKVKPDSVYKDDYTYIDFWIDKKLYLPSRLVVVSVDEEDISKLDFVNPKVNAEVKKEIFKLDVPKDFPKPEIIFLEKKSK